MYRVGGITRFAGCDTPLIGQVLLADKVELRLAVMVCHLESYLQAAKAGRGLGIPVMARTDYISTHRDL